MDCPLCGGPLRSLGYLGLRRWFRCLACGAECSSPAPKRKVNRR